MAAGFAHYLAKTGKFAHEADGREPSDRAAEQGYRYCLLAENLALNLDSRGFESRKLAGDVLKGWKESKIIIRFWIASLIFALFSLSTLKLR